MIASWNTTTRTASHLLWASHLVTSVLFAIKTGSLQRISCFACAINKTGEHEHVSKYIKRHTTMLLCLSFYYGTSFFHFESLVKNSALVGLVVVWPDKLVTVMSIQACHEDEQLLLLNTKSLLISRGIKKQLVHLYFIIHITTSKNILTYLSACSNKIHITGWICATWVNKCFTPLYL